MNDDDISELILRASAYLDGVLSADEMALAEADPAVMAEVEALRALQEQLADVDPPDDETRERAIAAALDEFDVLHRVGAPIAEPAAAPSPVVVPFRPRPAYARWLTAAAAVVGIGILGAVIAGGQGGDDEQADGGAAATAAASATAEESARMEEAPLESDEQMAAEILSAADEAPEEIATMEATIGASAGAETATASEPAEGGGEPVTTTEPPTITTTAPFVDPPVSTVTPPTVPDDLGDIVVDSDNLLETGQQLLDLYHAGELPNTPETACTFGSFVVLSWAQFDVDGTLRPALIAADPEGGEVGAFDPETCSEFDIVVP